MSNPDTNSGLKSVHTAGPYSTEYRSNIRITGNFIVVLSEDRYPVAFVPAWDEPEPGQIGAAEEAKANAKLLASVDELLKVLREIEDFTDNMAVRASCRNAILKATGGAL